MIGKCLLPIDAEPPCPFLFQLENKKTKKITFLCHLVTLEQISQIAKNNPISSLLGIGKGCCSD
jgi:hypothetical protein